MVSFITEQPSPIPAGILPNPRFIFTVLCEFKKTRPLKSKKALPSLIRIIGRRSMREELPE
jgi:hypothetical protein